MVYVLSRNFSREENEEEGNCWERCCVEWSCRVGVELGFYVLCSE